MTRDAAATRFRDRAHAGGVLAAALARYAHRRDVIVLALPRGGVPVGCEVARALGVPLDVFVVRKLGVPGHEELAMGAIASGSVRLLNEDVVALAGVSEEAIDEVAAREAAEIRRRERVYRGDRGPPDLRGRTVILVDDGLATGASMRAAAAAVRRQGPAWAVVAVPAAEYQRLVQEMLGTRTLIELNQQAYPGCYLHRSDPSDVARTEHLTFVCSRTKEDAGPNNNWMSPADAKEKVGALFAGAMRDRTMYVVPYLMGPVSSPYSQVGVEITDSPYVAVSMRIMTRMGKVARDRLGASDYYVKGLHSLGDLSPDRRFILHFPEERTIWSVGSGYGGNALLGKKCHSLRIASWMAREE